MSQRLKITEAPIATLGATGIEQNIPIAQVDVRGVNKTQRTTIEDMREYFSVTDEVIQPISQIGIVATGDQTITIPGGIIPGQRINAGALIPQQSTIRELTSETGNLITIGDVVFIRNEGTYKISIRIQVEYANARQVVSYRWLGDITVRALGVSQNFNGYYIRPTPSNVRLTYTLGEIETLINIPSGQGFNITMGLTHCGTTTSPTAGTETMDITGINASHPTIITVQRIGD